VPELGPGGDLESCILNSFVRTNMKKVLLAVIGIVVVALAVLPFVAGQNTQQSLDTWVAQMNQLGGYDFSWEKYQKGWLKTEAILKVGLKLPASLDGVDELRNWTIPLHLSLNHGPILWRDGLKPGWFSGEAYLSREHQDWVNQNLSVEGDGPFFVSKVTMDLAGNTTIRDRSLPFKVSKDADQLEIAGYQGEGTIVRGGLLQYSGVLDSMAVSSDGGNLQMKNMKFHMSSDFGGKVGQYALPGSAEFTVASMEAATGAGQAFMMRDATVSSDLSFNAEKTMGDMRMVMAFAELNVLEEKVENAKFDFSFNNLSLTFLNKYMELVQQMADGGEEQASMLAMQMMGLVSSDLLPAGPQVNIRQLGFKTPEGALDFNGSIAVSPEAAKDASNPMAILSHLTVNAALNADKPLAFRLVRQNTLKDLNAAQFEGGNQMTEDEKQALADNQAHLQLDMLTAQGMLVDKGEQYQAQFEFKDGAAVLNGQPMPLPF
jgi:uncharacterized protein YdgA (DUF945 family)